MELLIPPVPIGSPAALEKDELEFQETKRDKTQPALRKIQELLGDKYEFRALTEENSRNPDDLAGTSHIKILPPMSDRVPPALLAAMESVFGSKVPETDARKAIKKRWPGGWTRVGRKKSIPSLQIPMIWGAKYFAEGGLSLPPSLQAPSRGNVIRSYSQLEGQIAVIQRGVKSASSVSLALQAIKKA
jgi:hypothetical protein